MKNQDHNITSYVEKIQNTQISPHNPPKLFSIIPKSESKTLKSNELGGLMARAREWNEISES
jgi:hypothetical protein